MESVVFNYGDSTLPGVIMAGGSQQTAAIGASVIAAHNKLIEELLRLAGNDSPLAGLKAKDFGSVNGGLCKLNEPTCHETYRSLLTRAQRDTISVEAQPPQPLEMMHWSMHSYGAMFCEVRVSKVTGEPRITRFLGLFDCGRILNPKTANSQFRGGIIMGLGLALMEDAQFDERTGRIMNPSLAEYHVPVHMDVPKTAFIEPWATPRPRQSPKRVGARGGYRLGVGQPVLGVALYAPISHPGRNRNGLRSIYRP